MNDPFELFKKLIDSREFEEAIEAGLKEAQAKHAAEIEKSLAEINKPYDPQHHSSVFDTMTNLGYKKNLITGEWYK